MLIHSTDKGFVHPRSSEITPRSAYEGRRDLLKLMATGVAAACVSAMVFALYLHERTPALPWPVLAALWVGWAAVLASLLRMWLRAARRTMDFDPVMFAMQDRPTLVTATLALAVLTASSVFRGS